MIGAALVVMGGDDHFADQRAQQLLAVAIGGRRGGPQPRQIVRESGERFTLLVAQCDGAGALELGESAVLALELGERLFQRVFEGASDEPVLRLARVELPARAVGLVLGALDREALAGEPLLVLGLELDDRAGGRRDPGRCDRVQERLGDGLVQPCAAERLARSAGRVKVASADARVPPDLAVRARVRDLHLASAAPAADEPLQQRAAFARGAAALAARSHVRSQPLAGGEVLDPS